MFGRSGKEFDGPTGLVHVTVEFVGDFVPLCLLNVTRDSCKTDLGLGDNSLLTGGVFGTVRLVKRVFSGFSVNRVRRVNLGRLVTSVGGTLRVRSTVSDKTEDRESWGFSGSGVGSSRDQSSTCSSDSGEGLTARFLSERRRRRRRRRRKHKL